MAKNFVDFQTGVVENVKFRDPGNWFPMESDYEKNDGSSQTIPDDAVPLSEILRKYEMGIMPDVIRNPYYSDDGDFSVLNKNIEDLTELDDLDADIRREIEEKQAILEAEKAEAEKANVVSNQAEANEASK